MVLSCQTGKGALSSVPGVRRSYYVLCFLGLVMQFLSGWLLNRYVFPLYDLTNLYVREVATIGGAVALMVVALVATYCPWKLTSQKFVGLAVVCLSLGVLPIFYGIYGGFVVPLMVGAVVWAIGQRLVTVIICIACVQMPIRSSGICIAAAYMVAFFLRWVFLLLPEDICIGIYCCLFFVAIIIAYPLARAVLTKAFTSESPADRAVTKPSTFLPFNHQLFIALLVFTIVYGYTLTFGESGRVPALTLYTGVVLVLITLVAVGLRRLLDPDRLFTVAVLLVIAGFLFSLVPALRQFSLATVFLSSGIGCFDILSYMLLIALGSRNHEGSVAMFSWGFSLSAWGVVVGAQLGRMANDTTSADIVAAATVFAFIAYALIVFRRFSFKQSIESVSSTDDVRYPVDLQGFDERCTEIANRHGLTTREREVFILLAHGRNSRFVQDELMVSYNTVKVHVRHVYEKLDIHSQQELIDLVEAK